MDIFLEYLMKKKPKPGEGLIKFMIVVSMVFLMVIVFLGCLLIPAVGGTIALFGAAAVVYLAYFLVNLFNIEYEYIFTNGELDVDSIKAKKRRKHIVSIDCKDIELMAELSDEKFEADFQKQDFEKVYNAIYDESADEIYGIIFRDDGVKYLLKFQPTENLVDQMRKFNPRHIYKKAN